MAIKVTMIGGGAASFVPPLLRQVHQLRGARRRPADADGRRREPTRHDGQARREADRRRVEPAPGRRLPRPARVAARSRLRDRGDLGRRHGRLGGRHRDPGPLRDLHERQRLGRPRRDLPDTPQRARCSRAWPATSPRSRQVPGSSTTPTRRRSRRWRCSRCPAPRSPRCARAPRIRPASSGSPRQAGVEPDQVEMPPLVGGINHCAGVTELRLRDGRDGLELARERATEPIVKFALDTYGVLPYCWEHWTEFFPADAAPRRGLRRPCPGARDALRDHDARHGPRARSLRRARRADRRLDRSRCRTGRARRPPVRERGGGASR